MKCDELKAFRIIQGDTGGYGAPSYKCDTDGNRIEEWSDYCEVYHKEDVDKDLGEKDALLNDFREMQRQLAEKCGRLEDAIDKKDDEIAELKQKLEEKDEEIDKQKWRGDEWAKACNQKDKEIESLKASHYAEMVDAGMRERRLRRALYKACAMWADRTRLICSVFGSDAPKIRWERMLDKCRAKAEKYK